MPSKRDVYNNPYKRLPKEYKSLLMQSPSVVALKKSNLPTYQINKAIRGLQRELLSEYVNRNLPWEFIQKAVNRPGFISELMAWYETPEGHEFWSTIARVVECK